MASNSRQMTQGPKYRKLKDLSKQSNQNWPVCVWVNEKFKVTVSKKGKKYLKVILEDDSGTIQAMIYDNVEQRNQLIQPEKMYIIKDAEIKVAKKGYNSYGHDFELVITWSTSVKEFFTPISDLPKHVHDEGINIIGEVEEIGPIGTKDTRIKKNTPFRKVTIRDQTGSTTIVLWGDKAKQPLKKKDVVTVSPVKLVRYKGRLRVQSTYKSQVQVNPKIPEADTLKDQIDLPIDVTSEDEDTDIEMRGSQSINEESEESLTGPSFTNRGSKARKRISLACKTSSESSDSEAEMSPPRRKRLQNEKNQKKLYDYGRIRKKSSGDGTTKLKYGEDSQLEGKEESPGKRLRKTRLITAPTQTKFGETVGQRARKNPRRAKQPLKKKDVVTVSPVKLVRYKGRLSTYKSQVQVNPKIPEADTLKDQIDLPIDVTSEDEDTDIEMRGSQSINEESEESLTGPSFTNRGSKARKRISLACKTSSESSDSEAEMSPPRRKRLQNEKNQKKLYDYGRIRKKSSEDGTTKLKYGEDSQLEGKEESPGKRLRKTRLITAPTQTKFGETVGQRARKNPRRTTSKAFTSIVKTQRAIEGHTEDSDLSSVGSVTYKTPKKPVPLSDSYSEHDDVDDTQDDITDEIDTDTDGQSTYSLEDTTSVTTDKEDEIENASDANISNDSNDNDTDDDDDDGDGASPAQSDKSGDESGVTTDDDNDDDDDDDDDNEDGRPELIPDLVNVNQHLFGKVTSFVYWMVLRAYGHPTVPEQDVTTMKYVSSLQRKISSLMDACVSAAWRNGVKEALDSCPEMEMTERGGLLGIDDLTDCEVCTRPNHPCKYRVKLNGVSYDRETLQEQDREAKDYEYVMGQYCYRRVKFYHQLKHLKYSLYKECKRKLAKRHMNPVKLVKDKAFLNKHYNKIVKLFHEVNYEIMEDADANNHGTRFQRNFFKTSRKN